MFDEPFEFVLEDEAAGKDPGRVAPKLSLDHTLLDAYSRAVVEIVEAVGPAVVRVSVASGPGRRRRGGAVGSGFVISPDGLVLTTSHAVKGAKSFATGGFGAPTLVSRCRR
jgi:S1-C subfamily serine protease